MQADRYPQTVAAKVLPPRCAGLIERLRLLELVAQVSNKRLSVIKAPAGFGKTSLAVAWARAGDHNDARAVLGRVLKAGAGAGVYQTILDQGPDIGPLLATVRDDAAHNASSGDFVSHLDRSVAGHRAIRTK